MAGDDNMIGGTAAVGSIFWYLRVMLFDLMDVTAVGGVVVVATCFGIYTVVELAGYIRRVTGYELIFFSFACRVGAARYFRHKKELLRFQRKQKPPRHPPGNEASFRAKSFT